MCRCPGFNDGRARFRWLPLRGAVNRLLTEPTACSTHCSTQRAGEEMGMDDMDEIRMILAVRVLRKLINRSARGDGGEFVAAYRAGGGAIVEKKPMTRKD